MSSQHRAKGGQLEAWVKLSSRAGCMEHASAGVMAFACAAAQVEVTEVIHAATTDILALEGHAGPMPRKSRLHHHYARSGEIEKKLDLLPLRGGWASLGCHHAPAHARLLLFCPSRQ